MKTLTDFIRESEDQVLPPEETKKSLLALISSNFFRFANSEKTDTRSLLMLIAALGILSAGDDLQSLNIARRLATGALSRGNLKQK
jgi:hypothetical protein